MRRIETLEPGFRETVEKLLDLVECATNRKWGLSDGRRTLAQQKELYAQGRTKPGKIVTKAPPGSSAHNFGLAADLWPLTAEGDFDWNAPDGLFKQMADLAHGLGLVTGYYFQSFHDAPHVEAHDWRVAREKWRAGELAVA